MDKKLTPMLAQYFELKRKYSDMILFFRLGDFYEMFDEDAKEGARLLGLTLTARYRGTLQEIAMCGVPYHSAEHYIARLTKAGRRVGICEQLSEPSPDGIVERDVVKIVTPGTTLDETVISAKKNNYCCALLGTDQGFGVSFMDIATGEFQVFSSDHVDDLRSLLQQRRPSEIIGENILWIKNTLSHDTSYFIQEYRFPDHNSSEDFLKNHFQVMSLACFGIESLPLAIRAASLLLSYAKETQRQDLAHVRNLSVVSIDHQMMLDPSTIRNLELFETIRDGREEGSLLQVIDKTLTRMGARKLRHLLLEPLKKKHQIEERLNAVEELVKETRLHSSLRTEFCEFYDLSRLVGRIGCRSANARDLHFLQNNVMKIPNIKILLQSVKSPLLQTLNEKLDILLNLVTLLQESISPTAPPLITEGGMIADGFSPELDQLRSVIRNGQDWLLRYQETLRRQTGIQSLKVKFNKVFGYHIEVSKAKEALVPASFELKQNLLNDSRYMTPELKAFEEQYVNAEERSKTLEYELFQKILEQIIPFISKIQANAEAIAMLDVLVGFSELSKEARLIKPEIVLEPQIEIVNGRHLVIEDILKKEGKVYIANDTLLSEDTRLILLTGPNMAGKSSYLRQVALIVLLTHVGMFVPADKAMISVMDRIFTRVGAADDLSRGLSTFMVEMTEAANILLHATNRSLIIFDELGRGTSTYDGVSIAWAILEYVTKRIQALTLFATHYHELIDVVKEIPEAKNQSIAVAEKNGEVIFLRKVIDGGIDRSFGIDVAKLAGIPKEVIDRSKVILQELEKDRSREEQTLMGIQPTLFVEENARSLHSSAGGGLGRDDRQNKQFFGASFTMNHDQNSTP